MSISEGYAFASSYVPVCAPYYKILCFLAPTCVPKKGQMKFVTWTIYKEIRYYALIHVISMSLCS